MTGILGTWAFTLGNLVLGTAPSGESAATVTGIPTAAMGYRTNVLTGNAYQSNVASVTGTRDNVVSITGTETD